MDKEKEELNQYFVSQEVFENLDNIVEQLVKKNLKNATKDALNECIRHHQAIVKVCSLLEEFYNPFCLFKSLQMTIELCFLVFVSVNVSNLRNIDIICSCTRWFFRIHKSASSGY